MQLRPAPSLSVVDPDKFYPDDDPDLGINQFDNL
jgi:hypothetical protein